MARPDVELDLRYGRVSGLVGHPYIKLLAEPRPSRPGNCDGRALIRLDFDGPFKRVRFKLVYGEQPKLWTLNIADSPTSYGFGQNHHYTSNCAGVEIFNKQFRVYGNMQPGFRGNSINGHTLIRVTDNLVDVGTNLTIEVGDEMIRWKTQNRQRSGSRRGHHLNTLKKPSLYTLSGQPAFYGPQEHFVYAGFNRAPLSNIWHGSGLCSVQITLLREEGRSGNRLAILTAKKL